MRVRNKKHAPERLAAVDNLRAASFDVFNKNTPLHIEIGCGKGDFICTLAEQNPDINFIAVEKVTSVIILAMEKAAKKKLQNLKFVLGDALLLENAPENLCDRIYLNFSDPWPRRRHAKRRLTAPSFLALYKRVLKDDGQIHLKTDNPILFESSLNTLSDADFKLANITFDLHKSDFEGNVMTEYERNFSEKGFPIYRLEATPLK